MLVYSIHTFSLTSANSVEPASVSNLANAINSFFNESGLVTSEGQPVQVSIISVLKVNGKLSYPV